MTVPNNRLDSASALLSTRKLNTFHREKSKLNAYHELYLKIGVLNHIFLGGVVISRTQNRVLEPLSQYTEQLEAASSNIWEMEADSCHGLQHFNALYKMVQISLLIKLPNTNRAD
jgi:hypothetical protein